MDDALTSRDGTRMSGQVPPRWFDAQFSDGARLFTVGPFDTPDEAKAYGTAQHGAALRFLGVALRVGREELKQVAAQLKLERQGGAAQGKRRRGIVTRWEAGSTHGFITDSQAVSWFVSRDSLPDGHGALPVETQVTFAGSPSPAPGKRYPQAYSVQVETN